MATNIMKKVVEVFGRAERIAVELDVPYSTVKHWVRLGYVPRASDAVRLVWALQKRGSAISVEDISGVRSSNGRYLPPAGKVRGKRMDSWREASERQGAVASPRLTPAARAA